jgi:diguanylate cyclase (GGDEF)-like protein/PAS domain S-box-containing protein
MDAIGDLVWLQDVRGLCLDANPAFECLAQTERSQLLGQRLEDVLDPRLAGDLWQPDWPALQAGRPCTHEIWLTIETVPCLYEITHIPQRDSAGELVQIQSLGRDLTQRHQRIEQPLRDSRRQLADVIDFLPDALLAIDRDKRVIIWNQAIAKITGIPPEAMLGQGDYAYTVPFYGERRSQLMDLVFMPDAEVERRYTNVIREGDTFTAEGFCNALYDGRGAWILAKVAPLCDADGQVVGALEIIRDITERKQAEEALRRSEEVLALFIRHSPIYAYIKEVTPTESRVLQASDNFERMIGIRGSGMAGRRMDEIFPPEFAAKISEDDWRVVSNGDLLTLDEDFDGRHYTSLKFPIFQGGRTLLAGYTIDITERKQVEEALRHSQQYARSVLDAVTEAIFIHEADSGRILDVNRRACELYGTTREEMLAGDVERFSLGVTPYDQEHALMWLQRARTEGPQSFDWIGRSGAGETFWVEVNIRFAVISGEGRCIVTCRDIRARKQNENRLRQYESMITAMSDAVALIDNQYRYLIVNDEYQRRMGLPRERILGQTIAELLGESVFQTLIKERFDRCLNGETSQYQEWFDLPVTGRRFFDVCYAPYLDQDGLIWAVISSSRDITELKRLEEDLRQLTRLDPLTQLFNRRYFFTLAEQEYQRFRRYHRPMALCMIDIDHFKSVNDRYGHLVGDAVLCAVAETLRNNLRQVDILARYGGEEFVILLPETDLQTACASAERLRAAVAERRIETPSGPVSVTLSLGVVAIDDGRSMTLEQLLDAADQMLYRAKQAGRNRIEIWDLGRSLESGGC